LIPRVHRRGTSVGEVLRHLFGPGEYGDHHDPRVVAAWAYATTGGVDGLQPPVTAGGRRSLRRLVGLLEQPVVAGVNPPIKHVWHCSLHNHVDDPLLSDGRWAQVAAEFLAAVGLAPDGDLDAVRWLGIRHGPDHVHVVATLVRQDGRTVFAWNDYRLAQAAARELEIRYGLHRVAGRSPTPGR
jgi:peptidoglycan hydrolase-like protein with peptidoglycan-binding domain